MGSIAIYVQGSYAKKANKVDSYNIRAWPGIEMIRDVLERGGFDIEYCSAETVTRHSVILVSIVSAIDWFSFVAERSIWRDGNYTVVVGGPGVLNIRPFLWTADVFVFGRAENIIIDIVSSILSDTRYDHPSVCYSDAFSVDNRYEMNQVCHTYPHETTMANGKTFTESSIGCQRKCFFCNYSWTRKHVGVNQSESGAGSSLWGNTSAEYTIFELLKIPQTEWPKGSITIGMDGISERLRMMVNKPITDDMLERMFHKVANSESNRFVFYNIVGYPTESNDDYRSFFNVIERAPPGKNNNGIVIRNTPLKPTPCTPCAWWPTSYSDYEITKLTRLFRRSSPKKYFMGKFDIYNGNIWARLDFGTESLPTVAMWMISLRGTESDTDAIISISKSKRFARARGSRKLATLEKHFDMDTLFGAFTLDTLPTKYLNSYIPNEKMLKLGARSLIKHGGDEGKKIARFILGGANDG